LKLEPIALVFGSMCNGFWLFLLALSVTLIGCSHSAREREKPTPIGQWVLESYDSAKGYTFSKDGVVYQTTCFEIKGTRVRDEMQSLCARDLLPYIHKVVPITQNGDSLYFTITYGDGISDKIIFSIVKVK
jgi:hypothetical protein